MGVLDSHKASSCGYYELLPGELFSLKLRGWHVNSHRPLSRWLTEVSLWVILVPTSHEKGWRIHFLVPNTIAPIHQEPRGFPQSPVMAGEAARASRNGNSQRAQSIQK